MYLYKENVEKSFSQKVLKTYGWNLLVWDLPCMQQASYLKGGPLMWMLPLYMQVNKKSDYDYDKVVKHLLNRNFVP